MRRRPIRRGGMQWRFARVGVVLIVALAILVYFSYRLGDIFDLWTPSYELVALFPVVTGLSAEATVTVAGRRMGRVKSIELIPPERTIGGNHVLVRLDLSNQARDQIRTDSRARLRLQGLLGDRCVDIEPGTAAAPVLQPGDTIPVIPPFQLEEDVLEPLAQILDETRFLIDDLHQVSGRLVRGEGTLGRLLVDEALYAQMTSATAELNDVLREINRADGTFSRMIRDPTLYQQLTNVLARIDAIGEAILHGEGAMGRLLTDDTLFDQLESLLANADTAVTEISAFLERVAQGEGTLHRLLEDPMLYDELLKAVIDAQHLIMDIRRDPKRYRPEVRIRLFGR
jgi:phospholipid/cholesterol/gamma-HCH transport system substrate-binding protein